MSRADLKGNRPMRGLRLLVASLAATSSMPAYAQYTATDFTSAMRYDVLHRIAGTISADPDGGDPLPRPAVRNTYDVAGRLTKVEKGSVQGLQGDPASWSGFVVDMVVDTTYDAADRKLTEKISGGTQVQLTQYSYDAMGRVECVAVRMNPNIYGALPSSACSLGTEGSQGPDRITKNSYDVSGQLIQVRKAVGTGLEEAYVTYSYTDGGKQEYVIDAKGNRAKMDYDGLDRLQKWIFPSPTVPGSFNDATQVTALASAGGVNAGDYEQYGYDANSNRTSFRKRDGSTLTYSYDALNRMATKVVPERTGLATTHTRDVYYGYDLQGHQTYARFDTTGGEGVTNSFDGFGRPVLSSLNMDGATRTLASAYDADGNRTQLTYPDTNTVIYSYDGLDRPLGILRSGTAAVAAYAYDAAGQRVSFNGGVNTAYVYDGIGRLTSLANNPAVATGYNNIYGFSYNPASQVTSLSKSNNAFVFSAAYNVNRGYTVNGLNQYGAAGAATFGYDANGNLTGDGFSTFTYDIENRLVSASGQKTATLRYDPLGRLYEISGGPSATVRFINDGDALTLEYDGSGNILRRYIHGADSSADDPIAWYEGPSFSGGSERMLRSDWQGSIALVTDSTGGNVIAANRYDEYGIPQIGNAGRFQYTGQAWITDLGMSYYKARIYSPTLGRFLQTDPIGYKDQINLYAYVANDPVNGRDFTGMYNCKEEECNRISSYLKTIREAVDTLKSIKNPTADQQKLIGRGERALGAIGTENDGNGVTVRNDGVSADPAGGTTKPHTNGQFSVTINFAKIDSYGGSERQARGASLLAHEAMHVYQYKLLGKFNSFEELKNRERASYSLQRGIGSMYGLPYENIENSVVSSCTHVMNDQMSASRDGRPSTSGHCIAP